MRLTTGWLWNTFSSTLKSLGKEPHGHTPWKLGYFPCPFGCGQLFFWYHTYRCFCSFILVQELIPKQWATVLSPYAWQFSAIATRHLWRLPIRSADYNWLTHKAGHRFVPMITRLPLHYGGWSQDYSFFTNLRKLWWNRDLKNVTRGLLYLNNNDFLGWALKQLHGRDPCTFCTFNICAWCQYRPLKRLFLGEIRVCSDDNTKTFHSILITMGLYS